MAPKQTDPQFHLRMTPEIKAAIERAAALNNRSMNAEILVRLEESLLVGGIPEADPDDLELLNILSELEQLKSKIAKLRR
jgi:hypothetical protein